MVKMCDLSETTRKALVHEVTWLMFHRYHIDRDSIDEFWNTVGIGIEARSKAWQKKDKTVHTERDSRYRFEKGDEEYESNYNESMKRIMPDEFSHYEDDELIDELKEGG